MIQIPATAAIAQPDELPTPLQNRLQQELSLSPIWEIRQVRVEQRGNSIYLEGRVKSFYLKQLAQETIRRAANELPIVNDLFVD